MLKHAFKEWAVICKALAEGRQALILRKGGIEEPEGDFQVEHTRFWLFPTYVHQQSAGLQERALPLLKEALAEKPPTGVVRLSHFAEITGVYRLRDLPPALLLAHLHLWSNDTVAKRFEYRAGTLCDAGAGLEGVRGLRVTGHGLLPGLPQLGGFGARVANRRSDTGLAGE